MNIWKDCTDFVKSASLGIISYWLQKLEPDTELNLQAKQSWPRSQQPETPAWTIKTIWNAWTTAYGYVIWPEWQDFSLVGQDFSWILLEEKKPAKLSGKSVSSRNIQTEQGRSLRALRAVEEHCCRVVSNQYGASWVWVCGLDTLRLMYWWGVNKLYM